MLGFGSLSGIYCIICEQAFYTDGLKCKIIAVHCTVNIIIEAVGELSKPEPYILSGKKLPLNGRGGEGVLYLADNIH